MTRKRGTVFQWLAGLVSHSSNQMDMEWDEDDKMLHLGTPVPVILSGNLNTAGTIQPNSATGTVPVTEASGAAISTNTGLITYINGALTQGMEPRFLTSADVIEGAPARIAGQRALCQLSVTADAGGTAAATTIVPAKASYKACLMLYGFWTSVADPSGTFTLGATSGVGMGPTVFVLTSVASTVAVISATGQGVSVKATAPNEAITLALTTIGANSVVWPVGYYWYES